MGVRLDDMAGCMVHNRFSCVFESGQNTQAAAAVSVVPLAGTCVCVCACVCVCVCVLHVAHELHVLRRYFVSICKFTNTLPSPVDGRAIWHVVSAFRQCSNLAYHTSLCP